MVENSPPSLQKLDAAALGGRHFRYYDYIMAAFVTVLLLSNVLGAGKRAVVDLPWLGEWPFGAGILFFPIRYIIRDVLTEVYGSGRARRCILAGFAATMFMALIRLFVVDLPPAEDWYGQGAFEAWRCEERRGGKECVSTCSARG